MSRIVSTIGKVKEGVYQRLANDSNVLDQVSEVFDEADRLPEFPYIRVGNVTGSDWGTKTSGGQEVSVTIHTWSDYPGDQEVMDIHPYIIHSLNKGIDLGDLYSVVLSGLESEEVVRNPDSRTRQGILIINFNVMEV